MPTLPGNGWVKSFSQGRQNERSLFLQSGILLWQPAHFLPFSPLAALLQEVREKFQLTLHMPFPTLQWPRRRCWKWNWNLREVQLINMPHRATYLDSFANEAPSVLPDCCGVRRAWNRISLFCMTMTATLCCKTGAQDVQPMEIPCNSTFHSGERQKVWKQRAELGEQRVCQKDVQKFNLPWQGKVSFCLRLLAFTAA